MTALDVARRETERGRRVIPIPHRSKAPVLVAWQTLRLDLDDLPRYFNGEPSNIGVLLGEPSGHLVDIDLDAPEAVALADGFLPTTRSVFGRTSKPRSHREYICEISTEKFADVEKDENDATAMLVEIRSTGSQTMWPSSTHPKVELIEWGEDGEPAHVDRAELRRGAAHLACAAVLARHWPRLGLRHDAALAAAGFLVRGGVDDERVVKIVANAARIAGDDEWSDRKRAALDTIAAIRAGESATGGPRLAELLTGNGAKVVERMRKWLGAGDDDRPEIDTGALGLDEMAAAAWAAIEGANVPPRVFRYAGGLAWVVLDEAGLPGVQLMNQDHVRHHLADVARFIQRKRRAAFPPVALAADLLAVPRATIPQLARLVHGPVFTSDGRLLTTPGYDAVSGLYLAPPADLVVPAVPVAPSGEDIAAARELLCAELFGDFPCVGDADRAHMTALVLTPLLRELFGCVPLTVISKPTPRTGAGLATKVVSIALTGRPIHATTVSREEEENRKRLTALLIPAPAMILLDNLHGRLDSAALAAILTTGEWKERLLGVTQTVTLTVRSVFIVTGNNVTLSNEIAGRSVLIRLDPKIEDPSTRTGFRHPNLEAWATANRGRLLWAALVLGQAWIAAGRPRAEVAFGGFEEWAAVLGGVLDIAGIPGFLGNRRQLFERADQESAYVRAFLADWWQTHQDRAVLIKKLIDLAKDHPLPITSRSEQGTLIRLGQFIQSLEDRRYDLGDRMVAVRRAGEFRRAVLWQLACESDESCESSWATRKKKSEEKKSKWEMGETHSQDSSDSHGPAGPAAAPAIIRRNKPRYRDPRENIPEPAAPPSTNGWIRHRVRPSAVHARHPGVPRR